MASIKGNIGFKRMPRWSYNSEVAMSKQARESINVLMENFQAAMSRIDNVTPEALEYGLNPTHQKSLELVPKDTWRLHDSGYIDIRKDGDSWVGEVGFAKGGNPAYAVLVHENLEAPHDEGTQALFLEEALNQHGKNIAPRVASFMRGKLKS